MERRRLSDKSRSELEARFALRYVDLYVMDKAADKIGSGHRRLLVLHDDGAVATLFYIPLAAAVTVPVDDLRRYAKSVEPNAPKLLTMLQTIVGQRQALGLDYAVTAANEAENMLESA